MSKEDLSLLEEYKKLIKIWQSGHSVDFSQINIKIEKAIKALEIIKECFDINGFDEFIPNIKWYDKKNENKRKLIEEVFYEQK